jgi:hypothetical protein
MNNALTLRSHAPINMPRLLIAALTIWLSSAASLAPTLLRTAALGNHATVCHCAQCPGGKRCCCGQALRCPAQ